MKKVYFFNFILIVAMIVILAFPLLVNSVSQSFFYGIDPGVVYVTNAILYTKSHIITYMDHPGTPTIMLLYYLFIPLRLITKFLLHQNFIQWSFDNFAFLFLYARVFQLLIVAFALWLFQKVVGEITNSKSIAFLSLLLAFSFSGALLAISILPENLSFLLTAIWLLVFIKYLKKPKFILNLIMIFIAGITVANKFTALFLLIASVVLPISFKKINLEQKIIRLEANLLLAIQSFVFGIWPIKNNLNFLINWTKSLFGHSEIHGTGNAAAFDLGSYLLSLSTLLKEYYLIYLLVIAILVLGLYLLVKNKIQIFHPVFILNIISVIGFFVFSKYPIIHYNYVNLLLMVFSGMYFLSKSNIKIIKILITIMLLLFLRASYGHITSVNKQMKDNSQVSIYPTLSQWTFYWSSDVYREQLDKIKTTETLKKP